MAVADAPAPFLMNVLVPAQPFSLETMNVTATENLLARKAKLLRQLGNGSSDAERDEIERQIAQIDTALDLLEAFGARTDHKKR